MDFNANDVGFVPRVAGHYIENSGNADLVFLEMFKASEYMNFSLNKLAKAPATQDGHVAFESGRGRPK